MPSIRFVIVVVVGLSKSSLAMASLAMVVVLLLLLLCLCSVDAAVDTVYHSRTSDRDLAERKVQCYQDIDNGLWGDACKTSPIDKENCALICVSSSCYDSVYGVDPLEEGEIDLRRGRQFKACIRGQSKAERMAKCHCAQFVCCGTVGDSLITALYDVQVRGKICPPWAMLGDEDMGHIGGDSRGIKAKLLSGLACCNLQLNFIAVGAAA